ncbi:hypothetical protein [Pararhodobacter sp.]|uniref:hypothetical protein n=1 Tax=Pararhodobacter sp. TaxID=2127056 RepID=UPI002FDE1181
MAGQLLIPLATALAGLTLLAALTLQPQPGAGYGLLFPPWVSRAEAFSRAAALEMPITDIRLGGRLIVLAPGPGVERAGSRPPGALVIHPYVAVLCAARLPPEEPLP